MRRPVSHDTIVRRAPSTARPGASSHAARPPVLVLRDGRYGIRLTGKPPRLHLRAVRGDGFGFFGLRSAIRLGLLLCRLARMHDHKRKGLESMRPSPTLDLR